ncbi:shikimate dehydrogenase [Lentzea nigeriaca]|uniref:shikimate dehydrogenase n=1 Tax=Lentzea nigeriaca TaxID=1128665 RepID=UPI0027DABC4E|nr:shikimate dehydrogenase [Lentzea nigeriaca]MBM7856402.1 shikimate dehydrogenase [Lentzea nigeriaca]
MNAPLRVGLIGRGIGPSFSPALHEREAAALGVSYRYRLWDLDVLGTTAEDIPKLLRRARDEGYRGLNITHPCKQLVIGHLDRLSPDAEAIGAVNTVVLDEDGMTGHNTDWQGFREGFLEGLPEVACEHVVLLGAGGAGAAAAHALLSLGTARLDVLDVEAGRADALAAALTARFGSGRAVAGHPGDAAKRLRSADGLVHATPTGMAAHPGLPLEARLLRPDLWVAEIVYMPMETELLRNARAIGARHLSGGRMVVHQAAEAMRLFTGLAPDASRMLRHLAELLRR